MKCFLYAAQAGADIVQASVDAGAYSQALSDAVTSAPNTLFVVAAGNETQNVEVTPSYPCSLTAANLICIAATNEADSLASYSNYGATSVDLAAPGSYIRTAVPSYQTVF